MMCRRLKCFLVLPQVRVCMVDTGIDITHPDLIQNLWMNQVEMNGPGATAANGYKNGIDDDGNGEERVPVCPACSLACAAQTQFLSASLPLQHA